MTFHCQQAVEKYLKSYLIFKSITFRFSHDLIYLLELIVPDDPEFETYFEIVSELQSYAVEVRYPGYTGHIVPPIPELISPYRRRCQPNGVNS